MITAFIPARGGSKSIPLKNIKMFCGMPLIYWNLNALQNCSRVDEIIVATDSDLIKNTVLSFLLSKVKIYDREPNNAQDTSSTESVMLEYLNKSNYKADDVFILVQATSPLTRTADFDAAIQMYFDSTYDSLLTGVRTKRFYWDMNGKPINYDYQTRPRRQNFDGIFLENGAFYINRVANILIHKNRLSGNIGLYEMPEYTGIELDEPDDWDNCEGLMKKNIFYESILKRDIRLFITDVDGVLTDAGMYYSESGDELKKFNTHDGKGIELLRHKKIKTAIITSEETKIVENRAQKLKIDYVFQGVKDKVLVAQNICDKENITLDNVAYIGDDINDYELLMKAGLAACPYNAVDNIKSIPGIIHLTKKGGEGAVREFIEMILEQNINSGNKP